VTGGGLVVAGPPSTLTRTVRPGGAVVVSVTGPVKTPFGACVPLGVIVSSPLWAGVVSPA